MGNTSGSQDQDSAATTVTVVLLASIVRTLDGRFPGVLKEVEEHLAVAYKCLRDLPGTNPQLLGALKDFSTVSRMT